MGSTVAPTHAVGTEHAVAPPHAVGTEHAVAPPHAAVTERRDHPQKNRPRPTYPAIDVSLMPTYTVYLQSVPPPHMGRSAFQRRRSLQIAEKCATAARSIIAERKLLADNGLLVARSAEEMVSGIKAALPSSAEKKAELEAIMERDAISAIHKAMPHQWQAAAWYLERRFPDKYARRDPSSTSASIIGIRLEVHTRQSPRIDTKLESYQQKYIPNVNMVSGTASTNVDTARVSGD